VTAADTPGAIGRTPRQVAGPEVDRLRESEALDDEPDTERTAPAGRSADDSVEDGGVDGPEPDGADALDPDPEVDTEPVATDPGLDPDPGPDTEPVVVTDPGLDPDPGPDTEPVATKPQLDPDPDAEVDTEPVATDPGLDPDPGPDTEPMVATEPDLDPYPEPDTEPMVTSDLDLEVTPAGYMGETDDLRRRWETVQASFVDDPRQAVEQADAMVSDAVAALQAHIEQRREDLAETWRESGQASTDALLVAFQRYRDLFDGVLST
jgi:hypothetical protein